MRWDLAFTPEVSGHGQGHLGCCEGGISIQRKRENIYITKKKWRETRARDRENGRKEEEGDLVSVRRGMCKGGKVETG